LADAANHHPDVDLRYAGVTVRLWTHDVNGLSERDVELARRISAAARQLAVAADPAAVQDVQIAIDALVRPEVIPFWRAVLGYRKPATKTCSILTSGGQRCGSNRQTCFARSATVSTSTSLCRTTKQRRGSPRP